MTATGMIKLYPGVCGESRWFSHAHFFGHKLHTSRGQNFYSSTSQAFLGPYQQTNRDGCPRFSFCS